MSFYNDLQNNPRSAEKSHLPSDVTAEIHVPGNDAFPKSQSLRLVPLSKFNVVRTKPQTQLQTTLFQDGNQVDYYINSGFTEKLWLEFEFNVVNAPVTLNLEFCIDRIEIISNGQILSTIRDYNLYHEWLFKSYEQTIREVPNNGKNTSLVAQPLAVGFFRKYLHLNCFIDSCEPKLNAIKGQLLFRIYFSSKGVTGLTANCQVQLADILSETHQLSNMGESLENQRKSNRLLKYRFLNPIRAASETITMNASQQYNIRLTSLNSLSAFIIFHITPVASAPDVFSKLDSFELLDENNVIVGLKTSHEQSRIISHSLPGYLATLNENIYVVPFSYTALARKGCVAGLYKMTTKEQIKLYTSSTWVNGSYTVNVFSYDYNIINIDKGVASVSK